MPVRKWYYEVILKDKRPLEWGRKGNKIKEISKYLLGLGVQQGSTIYQVKLVTLRIEVSSHTLELIQSPDSFEGVVPRQQCSRCPPHFEVRNSCPSKVAPPDLRTCPVKVASPQSCTPRFRLPSKLHPQSCTPRFEGQKNTARQPVGYYRVPPWPTGKGKREHWLFVLLSCICKIPGLCWDWGPCFGTLCSGHFKFWSCSLLFLCYRRW